MRLLMWHVDHFTAEPTERGRSPIADTEPQPVRLTEGLVVFAAVERRDEADVDGVVARATEAIADVAGRVGARTLVLHSFAHLFVPLATPKQAKEIFDALEASLRSRGFTVAQTAFGWFNRLDLRTKGHPLSRVAREV